MAALVVIDLVARLAVPVALLVLMRGHAEAAIAAAAGVNVLAVMRGVVSGRATETVLHELWSEMVSATMRYDIARLRTGDDMHSVAAQLEAVGARARFESTTLPQTLANAIGLVVVVVAVVVFLGPVWLLVGVGSLVVAAPPLLLGHRYLRRRQTEAFDCFNDAARGYEVLLDGAAELRSHGVEARHAEQLLARVQRMAKAERKAKTTSVLMGLLPVGLALLAAILPLRDQLDALGSDTRRIADIGIIGATALAIALGLLRNLEAYARATPLRRISQRFIAQAPAPRTSGTQGIDLNADVELDAVGFAYPGAIAATPDGVTATWSSGEGLALGGDNGAGKTTLALCMIGLLEPTAGDIRWGETSARDVDWGSQRAELAYVPQAPFISPHRTVAWHLRWLHREEPTDAALLNALAKVSLRDRLSRGGDPLAVPAAELSGGERKRLSLARVLLSDPKLVVLDEPEAGLDSASRVWLRDFIGELATSRRVLLIAHDENVIPEGFRFLKCARSVESAAITRE